MPSARVSGIGSRGEPTQPPPHVQGPNMTPPFSGAIAAGRKTTSQIPEFLSEDERYILDDGDAVASALRLPHIRARSQPVFQGPPLHGSPPQRICGIRGATPAPKRPSHPCPGRSSILGRRSLLAPRGAGGAEHRLAVDAGRDPES